MSGGGTSSGERHSRDKPPPSRTWRGSRAVISSRGGSIRGGRKVRRKGCLTGEEAIRKRREGNVTRSQRAEPTVRGESNWKKREDWLEREKGGEGRTGGPP